jgi:RimJ/RimL family protein N-acetyltransferase
VRDALVTLMTGAPVPSVQLYRPATAADGPRLLEWRNDPSVRAVSGTTRTISASEHAAWLPRVLADPERTLLIVEREGDPVGSVRFDRRDGEAEISITVAPAQRGYGIGAQAIRETTEHELAARAALGRVVARVGAANAPSRRAFEHAGYRPHACDGGWFVLESLR